MRYYMERIQSSCCSIPSYDEPSVQALLILSPFLINLENDLRKNNNYQSVYFSFPHCEILRRLFYFFLFLFIKFSDFSWSASLVLPIGELPRDREGGEDADYQNLFPFSSNFYSVDLGGGPGICVINNFLPNPIPNQVICRSLLRKQSLRIHS